MHVCGLIIQDLFSNSFDGSVFMGLENTQCTILKCSFNSVNNFRAKLNLRQVN
jgi:hypothetical protein